MQQILDFFIQAAHADQAASAATPQASSFSFIAMMAVFFVFIYFTMLRPQAKRAKEQQSMLQSLAKGDEVATVGGLLGTIEKITDPYIILVIADNTQIIIQKSSVATVLPKGTLKTVN